MPTNSVIARNEEAKPRRDEAISSFLSEENQEGFMDTNNTLIVSLSLFGWIIALI